MKTTAVTSQPPRLSEPPQRTLIGRVRGTEDGTSLAGWALWSWRVLVGEKSSCRSPSGSTTHHSGAVVCANVPSGSRAGSANEGWESHLDDMQPRRRGGWMCPMRRTSHVVPVCSALRGGPSPCPAQPHRPTTSQSRPTDDLFSPALHARPEEGSRRAFRHRRVPSREEAFFMQQPPCSGAPQLVPGSAERASSK